MSRIEKAKTIAAILLITSLALPLSSVWQADESTRIYDYSASLAINGVAPAIPLAIAYFWPVFIFLLFRLTHNSAWVATVRLFEFGMPVLSGMMLTAVSLLCLAQQGVFAPMPLFSDTMARPELGCYLGLFANSLYFVANAIALIRGWMSRVPPSTERIALG